MDGGEPGGVKARPHDNTALINRILALRAEKAALLGLAHFADFAVERRMAKTGQRALDFINDLHTRAASPFARECRELEEFRARETGTPRAPPRSVGDFLLE